ncbi:MAG: exodeoxyribonuclease VII small subunit [Saprospiraceae bacterium]|jgi:exodeoxyribonuclease VII small subunit|nr:exodeoxyribonuclease VII small subunit [Saprospiraceae bacterium]MBP6238154.1 exodeoxyribonuclease VII small subunit [Saprospiraceae bacterium]MBP6566620.1 exodeoxyribonuclease VII small subunit [Saprospiraceae bacterium]
MSKKMTYDTAYAELNNILISLQSDETGLDDLSEKLKRAAELSEFCKSKLRSIETDIEKISPSEQ